MSKSVAIKLAGAAALAATSQAYGQIVPITLPPDLTGVPQDGSEKGEFYNVMSGAILPDATGADFKFEAYNGPLYFFTAVTPIKTTDAVVANYSGGFYASALMAGDKVGTDISSFTQGFGVNASPANLMDLAQSYPGGPVTSYQQPNTVTYMGFQFADGTGGLHDGYVELESTYAADGSSAGLLFLGGAYNAAIDTGDGSADIVVGEVPEPHTLSALVLGAAALGAVGLQRRRRAAFAMAQS